MGTGEFKAVTDSNPAGKFANFREAIYTANWHHIPATMRHDNIALRRYSE
jgi:hypothetical protein